MENNKLSIAISNLNEIGHVIRAIRTFRGVSQTELAKRVSLSNVTVSLIERGDRSPSLQALSAILFVLEAELTITVKATEP